MRFLKQLIYGIFWLIVLAGIGYGGYRLFLKPAATCNDNIKNGREEGVDCGTVCGRICLPPELKISVLGNVQMFPIGTSSDHVSFLVQVQNSSGDFAARSFKYDLKITGSSSSEQDINGESFLYAADRKYLAFPNVAVSGDAETLHPDFTLGEINWVKDADFSKPQVTVQNYKTQILSDHMEVQGKLVNNAADSLTKIGVVAIFLDQLGGMAGVSQTEVDAVASGEARSFTVWSPLVPAMNASLTRVYLYPYR